MRAVVLSLILMVTHAVADLPLQMRELEPQEKAWLLSHARETCVADPVEVSGFSHEGPYGNTWEAHARVYFAPHRSYSSLCKSRIIDIRGGRFWCFPIKADLRRVEGPARERETKDGRFVVDEAGAPPRP